MLRQSGLWEAACRPVGVFACGVVRGPAAPPPEPPLGALVPPVAATQPLAVGVVPAGQPEPAADPAVPPAVARGWRWWAGGRFLTGTGAAGGGCDAAGVDFGFELPPEPQPATSAQAAASAAAHSLELRRSRIGIAQG